MYKFLRPIYAFIKLSCLYLYDLFRFAKYSGAIKRSKASTRAKITELSHSVERGLSLKNSKQDFGKEKIRNLFQHMSEISASDFSCSCAASALIEYIGCNPNDIVEYKLKNYNCSELGGTKQVFMNDILAASKQSFDIFSQSRFSVRDFSEKEVDLRLLKTAIKIAQKSPSACNRQPTRIYIITDKNDVYKVLELQGGANGFKEHVNKLLIVSSDKRAYIYANERNLYQLDSGMFGMSLLYALHFLELGACPLMWANTYKKDKLIRKICKIDNYHDVVFIIAVGHLPGAFKVAKSPRLPLDDIQYVR